MKEGLQYGVPLLVATALRGLQDGSLAGFEKYDTIGKIGIAQGIATIIITPIMAQRWTSRCPDRIDDRCACLMDMGAIYFKRFVKQPKYKSFLSRLRVRTRHFAELRHPKSIERSNSDASPLVGNEVAGKYPVRIRGTGHIPALLTFGMAR